MIKNIALIAAAATLAGCASTPQPIPLTKPIEDQAKMLTLKQAYSPADVQFGPMKTFRQDDSTTVCALINGANPFGGRTGWEPVFMRFPDDGSGPSFLDGRDGAIRCPKNTLGLENPVDPVLLRKNGITAR